MGSGDRVLGITGAEEHAVVDPPGLDELELPPQVGSDEGDQQAAVGSVVLQNTVGQWRAVRRRRV
ncbi:hypothetical protein [Streptomyces sp. cg2]|uniref:hypothetical protein n=1 Tax=Streptomyces sp. cg2 TaxID=3238799 RepID=UPI0034E1BD63